MYMGLIGVTIVSHKVARTGRERRTPATRGVVTDHIAQACQSWKKDMSLRLGVRRKDIWQFCPGNKDMPFHIFIHMSAAS